VSVENWRSCLGTAGASFHPKALLGHLERDYNHGGAGDNLNLRQISGKFFIKMRQLWDSSKIPFNPAARSIR